MKLIIGGMAQGKLQYVLQNYHLQEEDVSDGALAQPGGSCSKKVINHFHRWFRDSMTKGECPEQLIQAFLEKQQDCIIISNEVGNGIVPIDQFEREFRERLGRTLTALAAQAEEVERVICGLGQRLK